MNLTDCKKQTTKQEQTHVSHAQCLPMYELAYIYAGGTLLIRQTYILASYLTSVHLFNIFCFAVKN